MVSAPDCVSIETLGEMQAAHETETQKVLEFRLELELARSLYTTTIHRDPP